MNSQSTPSPAPSLAPSPALPLRPNRRFISPRARRALAERGLDLASLQGSGPDGRIVEADVLRAQVQQVQSAAQPEAQAPEAPALSISAPANRDEAAIPQMTLRAEVDAGALLEVHRRFGDHALRGDGPSWTPGDFLLCCVGRALRAHAAANRAWREGAIVDLASVDIGFLCDGGSDGEAGRACSIGDAGRLSLLEAAQQRQLLESDAGREPAAGGAMLMLDASTCRADEAWLPLPWGWSGSLGAGRIAERPFVVSGELCVRPTLHLALCVDTRIWSPGLAARFLDFIVERVQEPNLLIFG